MIDKIFGVVMLVAFVLSVFTWWRRRRIVWHKDMMDWEYLKRFAQDRGLQPRWHESYDQFRRRVMESLRG